MAALKEIEESATFKPAKSASFGGFSTANGKYIKLSDNVLQKAKSIFGDEDLASCLEHVDPKDFSDSFVASPEPTVGKAAHTAGDLQAFKSEVKTEEREKSSAVTPANPKSNFLKRRPAEVNSAKKRLGISSCKQINISNEKLQRAKRLFDELEENNKNDNLSNANVNTPIKLNQAGIYNSTPLKETNAFKPFIQQNLKDAEIVKANFLTNLNITPVKKPQFLVKENYKTAEVDSKHSPIIIKKQTEGNVEIWLNSISKEYEELQQRLKIITERKKALEEQKELLENGTNLHRRQHMGNLLKKKHSSQRLSLNFLVNRQKSDNTTSISVPQRILDVTPKNAEQIHFNCNWQENSEGKYSVVHTTDGAALIPNSRDLIGLSEIKAAFKAMLGVDPKLLPIGWISNHFKWIVWKLASLERSFPEVFSGYLCIENVMQQLKYRYDREIDKAERSALRRIMEKDDLPQKRMILCVSDIFKMASVFELELTDGWYSIRTVIDQQLCKQIYLSRIVVGTKLIVQSTEIINCEGCHPLEVPSNVRLKINYNCTRRARWDSKLGYQKVAEPFPICLRSIHPDGGLIGCIKVYIARVYPLRYMERQSGRAVWRNEKADQKRAQEWENERAKEIEAIQQKIQIEYEKNIVDVGKNMKGKVDSGMEMSPSALCHLMENTDDPETLGSKFSSSQIASALEYKRNSYSKQQQELSLRISNEIKKLSSSQRDVSSVLKLRVVDVTEQSDRGFYLNIWRPVEEHLQILKEGCTFSIFNVLPKLNGDLATTAKTHFRLETTTPNNHKLQRYILSISMVRQLRDKPLFNEFDTIGTVVCIFKSTYYQEMWLSDFVGNLLLVKINEGSDRCSMFDNINRGQNVALMNLIFRESYDGFGQSLANQASVITSFPQLKLLQNELETYREQLPKDLPSFLNDCDKKIEMYVTKAKAMKSSINSSGLSALLDSASVSTSYGEAFDDSSEDNTMIPSRLTTTDVAMSLIDTDQFENI